MRTSLRVVGATCAAVLVLPACTSSSADPSDDETETVVPAVTPSPTTSDEPTASPTDTASPDDPFAVPDPITEEYVDRVVNTLYEEWGAITREILEQPADPSAITPVETRERIATLFGGQYLQRRLGEADQRLRGARDGMQPADEFGHVQFSSRRVFASASQCIVVAGDFDTKETAVDAETILVTLSLVPVEGDGLGGNPTRWKIVDLVPNTREGEPLADEVMLDATLDDFEGVLDTSCDGGQS